jgi:hypothetical protein
VIEYWQEKAVFREPDGSQRIEAISVERCSTMICNWMKGALEYALNLAVSAW